MPVRTSSHTVDSRSTDTARGTCLPAQVFREESIECIVATADGSDRRYLAIGLDAMLEKNVLPAGVTTLNTTLCTRAYTRAIGKPHVEESYLADVDADALAHESKCVCEKVMV